MGTSLLAVYSLQLQQRIAMPPEAKKTKAATALWAGPLIVFAVSLLVSSGSTEAGNSLISFILQAFGAEAKPLHEGFHPVEVLLQAMFAVVATMAGARLAAVGRTIVTLQLLVISIVAQYCLMQFLSIQVHPLGYITAIGLGCLAGYLVRMYELQEKRYESQYYELFLRNKELQDTKLQIVKQDEIERRMLAADLHDQVLNDLKAIVHKFDSYTNEPQEENATAIKTLLHQAMSEIREVMDSLCPSALEHLGMAAAIEDCLRRGSQRAGFKTRFRSKLKGNELDNFSMVEQSLLYRLIQESITNVCKHAEAATVRATLEMNNDDLVVTIADDGKGIDPEKIRQDSRGLRYMRQRADLIGATISWRAGDDNRGTVVEIRMSTTGRTNGENSGS